MFRFRLGLPSDAQGKQCVTTGRTSQFAIRDDARPVAIMTGAARWGGVSLRTRVLPTG